VDYRRCEIEFQLELARGTSFIASSMCEATLRCLVDETVRDFVQAHGSTAAVAFCNVLSDRLVRRQRPDAAAAVITSLEEATSTARPVSRAGS
jgi:hypothetical protein